MRPWMHRMIWKLYEQLNERMMRWYPLCCGSGSAPSPFVRIFINGELFAETAFVSHNHVDPAWDETFVCGIETPTEGEVELVVVDHNHPIGFHGKPLASAKFLIKDINAEAIGDEDMPLWWCGALPGEEGGFVFWIAQRVLNSPILVLPTLINAVILLIHPADIPFIGHLLARSFLILTALAASNACCFIQQKHRPQRRPPPVRATPWSGNR